MSISRLMLRSLACVAIQQQEGEDAPTMAEDRVFDSQLNPIVFREFDNKVMPGVIVYTEDDHGEIINRGSGSGPFRRTIKLRVEIVMGSFDTLVQDSQTFHTFAIPSTDAELEAKLDLLEQQVKWALFSLPNRPYTDAFHSFVIRVHDISSHAMRDETGNNKAASRVLIFTCEIPDDCPPLWRPIEPGSPPPVEEKIGFDDYPAPWLRATFNLIAQVPSARNVMNALAGSNNPVAYVPFLKRIALSLNLHPHTGSDDPVDLEHNLEFSE